MWTAEQKKGLAIVGVGHVLYAASRVMADDGAPHAAVLAVGAVSGALMMLGSALYVRGKGYSALWGLGGFLPFIGIGTLILIPAFPTEPPEPRDEAPATDSAGAP